MLWAQGETDSNTSNGPIAADSYQENLENLINSVRGHYDIADLPFLILGVGSKKVQNAMVQVSKKLTNVTFIDRSQDVNKSNYTPIYTHKWKGKPVGHYNYEGMKKLDSYFIKTILITTYIQYIDEKNSDTFSDSFKRNHRLFVC